MGPALAARFRRRCYPPVTSRRCSRSWRPSRRGRAATSWPPSRLPDHYRAAFVRREDAEMFAGIESADKDPRKSLHIGDVATPELAPDEAYVAVMASSINFNTVWTSIFEPLPTFGFLDRFARESDVGGPPRPAVPRRRLRRGRRRAARRLGGAQLEAGRPGHDPLQLRRRPGPVGPRRLDARRQPADLGLRDQLRRPRRPRPSSRPTS